MSYAVIKPHRDGDRRITSSIWVTNGVQSKAARMAQRRNSDRTGGAGGRHAETGKHHCDPSSQHTLP